MRARTGAKSARKFYVDNELRKAGNFGGAARGRSDLQLNETCEEEAEEEKGSVANRGVRAQGGTSRSVGRVAAKSAASGTTNQIFAPAARRIVAHCCFLYAKQG